MGDASRMGACLEVPLTWSCWHWCRKWDFEPMVRVGLWDGNRLLIIVLAEHEEIHCLMCRGRGVRLLSHVLAQLQEQLRMGLQSLTQ